jgi:hypothetical protein
MTAEFLVAPTVRASLKFAADRTHGAIWSNLTPSIITQKLTAESVEMHDTASLAQPPSLEREGFTIEHAPIGEANWNDQSWNLDVYMPQCLALVKRVTGAAHVVSFYGGAFIRDTGDPKRAQAAEFVHLDNTLESSTPFLERATDAETRRRFPHVKIFNVWRLITPPPQDVPLAICDQRTVDRDDWVIGVTKDPSFPEGVPYVGSVYNPRQKWWYVSNLTLDDAIIFKGYDTDPGVPFGCLHGAFKHPDAPEAAIPRASAETRIFALFEK